jgi:hypothetical protein
MSTLEVKLNDKKYKIYFYPTHTTIWQTFPIWRTVLDLPFHINMTPQNIENKLQTILLFS